MNTAVQYFGAQNTGCDVQTFGADHLTYAQALTGNYPIGTETLYKLDICENGYRHLHLDTIIHLANLSLGGVALLMVIGLFAIYAGQEIQRRSGLL